MTISHIARQSVLVVCLCEIFSNALPAVYGFEPDENNKSVAAPIPQRPKRYLSMKTLGGRQLWGDVRFFHRWRIQKNILTGHFRLLDGDDFRHASGTQKECEAKLAEITKSLKLPRMSGKAVILIHGIIRSSKSFDKMRDRLEAEGYHVFGFDYPSTRIEIGDSADYLHQCISSLEGIEEINLAVHSMGGLVTRAYLAEHRDKRLKRLVMMGVPNNGARMADKLKRNLMFRAIFGPAGQQLVSHQDGLIPKLPIPELEFAIIAGGKKDMKGYNPLLPGDDDGIVSVASSRLPGAVDFIVIRCLHSFLIGNDEAVECTIRFFRDGQLREKGDRRPIPKKQAPKTRTVNANGAKTP